MNTKTILGISLATVFAISMSITAAMASNDPSLNATDAGKTGGTFYMDLDAPVKNFNFKDAPDLVTFWAWFLEDKGNNGADARVAAITLHHNINDQAAFDPIFCGDDKSPQCQAIRSNPVQSFHPHYAEFKFIDVDGQGNIQLCVTNLESPNLDFRVNNQQTITLEDDSEDYADYYAVGTIGAIEGCPVGLGITNIYSSNLP